MLKIIFCSGKWLLPWSILPTSNQPWSPVSWFGFQMQVCPLQEARLFSTLTTSLFSPRFPYVNSTVGKQVDSCCLSSQHTGIYLIQLQCSHCGHAPTYSLTLYSNLLSYLLPCTLFGISLTLKNRVHYFIRKIWCKMSHFHAVPECNCLPVQLNGADVKDMWEHTAQTGKRDDPCFRDNNQLIKCPLLWVANRSKNSAHYLINIRN